jgi:chromosome segregation ATPase|tara:strand:- start:491 stop:814 length:324 start_codon:yes stop_codon:yes gene_type:complete
METLYIKEKKLETVLSKLKSLSGTPKSYIGQINELYEEKNQLEIEKKEAENKYNQLILEHDNLKKKLKALEQQNLRSQKLQDEVNQDINELSQETDSLVEEIDKWQT